ncbi:response regulator transcription factor [Acinetobacter sp. CUI P1]|nr:response regulator transcription factor [Acinetobacter sp. CUI P1]
MHNILIVDDEPLILEGLRSVIDWEDYGLRIAGQAGNGEEALEFLHHHNEAIDILITDITMPRLTGLELIQQIKQFDSKMRFIILSGYEQFEYLKAGMSLGIENYILKPINIKELESTIEQIVEVLNQEDVEQFHAKEDQQVLRNNILNRWVTGNIDRQELLHRSKVLNISLDCSFFTVAAIRLITEQEEEESQHNLQPNQLVEECYRIAVQSVAERGTVIAFIDMEGDLILIVAESAEDENKEEMYCMLEQVQSAIMHELGKSVWITIGSKEYTFQEVPQSYKKAKSLYVEHLMLPGYPIIDVDQLSKMVLHEDKLEIDYEAFTKLLLSGEREAANQFIEETFQKLFGCGMITRIDNYNVAIELMLIAKKMEKNSNFSAVFNPLLRIHTIEQLLHHVQDSVKETLDQLSLVSDELSPNMKYMVDQVSKHYREELSLKTLSQRMNMHPTYLGQLFQKEMGRSFSDYVNQFRIEKARQLLLQTTLLTNEIAAEVGYLDPAYFYRQFKKSVGISPTELRKMYKK